MLGGTFAARYCTLRDVCLTGGWAGVWPTTSTYREPLAPHLVTRSGSLPYSAWASRPGERSALLSAVFERQGRLIPQRDMGPPRNDQASTPIKPAVRPRGHSAQWVRRMNVGRARRKGPAGAVGRAPQQVGFGARSREEYTGRTTPGMEASGPQETTAKRCAGNGGRVTRRSPMGGGRSGMENGGKRGY